MSSPSTLVRLAKKAADRGHLNAAKRLREQAAQMRRDLRAKKKAPKKARKKAPAKKLSRKDRKVVADLIKSRGAVHALPGNGNNPDLMQRGLQEVHAEGGAKAATITDVAEKLVANKNGEHFAIELRAALIDARIQGENKSAAIYGPQIENITEAHRISIVSSFMAIVEAMERENKGLPATITMSGYTIAKVYDALRKAGYTRDGLNGGGKAREHIARPKSWQVVEADRPE